MLGLAIDLPIRFPDMKLTKANVTKLALLPGRDEALFWDEDVRGFGLRIRKGGSRVFVFQYKIGSRTRRITLGHCSALDPATARKTASEFYARAKLGHDPAAERDQRRTDETFGTYIKAFLSWQRDRVRASTLRHLERHLLINVAPLHRLPFAAVSRREVATQLSRLSEHSPVQANRTRSSVASYLSWAMREGLTEGNAALLTNKNAEQTRERVLSKDEVRTLWNALPPGDYADIVKVLLLTGQRATEIADLRWDEIANGAIKLPAARTKNRRPHTIPMSTTVRAILDARQQNGREHVFGMGQRGFSGWSKAKARLDEAIKIPDWRVHDLRRSCATGLGELGVYPHVIEAILNHVSGTRSGVAGLYNKAAHETEKAAALQRWAEHVAAIVEKENGAPQS
jgi:integrase